MMIDYDDDYGDCDGGNGYIMMTIIMIMMIICLHVKY